MKKKLLPLAMLAGLAGVAGTAQAVHVNPDGLGGALLFPYYTVEGGQDTMVTVVNTTEYVKAVKVRFLEARNSRETLDFNLYLSPYDHWSGVLTSTADGTNTLVKTWDTSCTVPQVTTEGIPFRNVFYTNYNSANQNADGGPTELNRTRQGHIEIIEMGIVDDTAAGSFGAEAASIHGAPNASGVATPVNCGLLRTAWQESPVGSGNVTGAWSVSTNNIAPFDPLAQGGLYGYATIVNISEGTNFTVDATALDNFASGILHSRPGNVLPALSDATTTAHIIEAPVGSAVPTVTSLTFDAGLDAVSAVLMHDSIINDYVSSYGLQAATDWVITFPTKHDYVNPGTIPARAPFLAAFTGAAGACEEVQIMHWDREEREPGVPTIPGGIDFSPSPIPVESEAVGFALCSETNVITFLPPATEGLDAIPPVNADNRNTLLEVNVTADGQTYQYSPALNATRAILAGFPTEFENGWARLTLANDNASPTPNSRVLTANGGEELVGLPVIGFAAQKFTNGQLSYLLDGEDVSVYYTGVSKHKTTRQFIVTP